MVVYSSIYHRGVQLVAVSLYVPPIRRAGQTRQCHPSISFVRGAWLFFFSLPCLALPCLALPSSPETQLQHGRTRLCTPYGVRGYLCKRQPVGTYSVHTYSAQSRQGARQGKARQGKGNARGGVFCPRNRLAAQTPPPSLLPSFPPSPRLLPTTPEKGPFF